MQDHWERQRKYDHPVGAGAVAATAVEEANTATRVLTKASLAAMAVIATADGATELPKDQKRNRHHVRCGTAVRSQEPPETKSELYTEIHGRSRNIIPGRLLVPWGVKERPSKKCPIDYTAQ